MVNDAFVPWSNNQYLADLLPNNEIHPLDAPLYEYLREHGFLDPASPSLKP